MARTVEDSGVEFFLNNPREWPLPTDLLEKGVRAVLEDGGVPEGELSITFLDDDGIAALNREHLGREGPTDVIAFTLHQPSEPLLGDVYVGYEQARRQSSELGVPLEEELLRLVVHGTLHVLGCDHPKGEDRVESPMFLKQEGVVRTVLGRSDPA